MDKLARYQGALLGLAVGDALGAPVEFRSPNSFAPLTDMVGGGPHQVLPGQWTDDTSMALCLGESLVLTGKFDPTDQMQRYLKWWKEGYFSSKGYCFDIGGTVSQALCTFEETQNPFSGPTGEHTAGNGSIMRLVPAVMGAGSDPLQAVMFSALSSRTTHGAITAMDACRYFGALLWGALNGVDKETLLSPLYDPAGVFITHPLAPEIAEVAQGSYKILNPPEIKGSGYVVKSLEAALWAFYHADSFREGALAGVNLGDDADTTGAVYGQIAGAYYGLDGIPREWREKVYQGERILHMAEQLFHLAGSIEVGEELL